MQNITDYRGVMVRLTDERIAHILAHPEMAELLNAIAETLRAPEYVIESASDCAIQLYYRYYWKTVVGDKYMCVVVKVGEQDAFVLTAYLTGRMKKGAIIWNGKP